MKAKLLDPHPPQSKEIEEAKAYLQKAFQLTEPEAYCTLQTFASCCNLKKQKVAEVLCKVARLGNVPPLLKATLENTVRRAKERILLRESGYQRLSQLIRDCEQTKAELQNLRTILQEVFAEANYGQLSDGTLSKVRDVLASA